MGRINGTGLRVTRRESFLLQIPVGSRPLSKLNPACASVTISRRGGDGEGQFSKFFQFISFCYCCCSSKLTFTRSKGRRRKKTIVHYRLSRLECIYISRYPSSPLFLNFERYTWWWMQKAREREQSRFKKSTNREVSSVANMFRKQGF